MIPSRHQPDRVFGTHNLPLATRLHLPDPMQGGGPNAASTALNLSARLLNTLCPPTRTARVLGQHHCLQRGTSAPDSKIIRRLLRLRQNASVFAQGCADFPSDSSDRDHSFTPDQDKSVSGQRCADLPASSADRSHHFKSDPWRTSSLLHSVHSGTEWRSRPDQRNQGRISCHSRRLGACGGRRAHSIPAQIMHASQGISKRGGYE